MRYLYLFSLAPQMSQNLYSAIVLVCVRVQHATYTQRFTSDAMHIYACLHRTHNRRRQYVSERGTESSKDALPHSEVLTQEYKISLSALLICACQKSAIYSCCHLRLALADPALTNNAAI